MNTESAKTGAYDVVVTVGSTTIYNSTVGGNYSDEFGIQNTGGLEELDALQDWVYLGTLSPGQTAGLRFALTMDGVSNGDAYQESAGSIDFNFAVAYNEAHLDQQHITTLYIQRCSKEKYSDYDSGCICTTGKWDYSSQNRRSDSNWYAYDTGTYRIFGLLFTRRKKEYGGVKMRTCFHKNIILRVISSVCVATVFTYDK